MLNLTRRVGETICIGEDVSVINQTMTEIVSVYG